MPCCPPQDAARDAAVPCYGLRGGLSLQVLGMEYTTLGRTGLKVSVAGLGTGGFSRLGLGTGKDENHAIGIIRGALDLGVNLFDTAAAYGTEPVLGKALRGVPREQIVICTKAPFGVSNPNSLPERAVASLERSLKELGTDYIDVYQLHG